MLTLSEGDLQKHLNVAALGQRRFLKIAIEKLKLNQPPAAASASTSAVFPSAAELPLQDGVY